MKLTQEQLAELIAKVFANLDEKRKAVSEGGESSPIGFGTDEILSEISAILEGMENSEPPVGEPVNEPSSEGEGDLKGEGEGGSPVSPEFIAKVIAALNGVKTAEGAGENNAPAAAPPPSRRPLLPAPVSRRPLLPPSASTPTCSYLQVLPATVVRRAALRLVWPPCLALSAARPLMVCLAAP